MAGAALKDLKRRHKDATKNLGKNETGVPKMASRLVAENFITTVIDQDLAERRYPEVVTRFPPEPNGYAHIGHAVASFLNFGLAKDYGGRCNLRFDDTNPETERMEYAEAIREDMRWLGWEWGDNLYFASDYFEKLYALALRLTEMGKAYVDSLSEEEVRAYRGTIDTPGRDSPYRNRSVAENLDLFKRMRAGEFGDGEHVLRAKIDMTNPNMKLRDPVLYRILHAEHYRTGNAWPIYPMYDFQHPLSDALEGVTHSLCSLEYVNNRAVYDWLMDALWETPRPRQYEFGRRSLEYTVVSKRKLIELVQEGHVRGWDDPRMPTLAGLRRRGVTPEAVRAFAGSVSISRTNRTVDIALLEHAIRDDLNFRAPRVMAVLDPLKVVITNYPENKVEEITAPYWPPDVPNEGSRTVPFSRTLYIERDDFAEVLPKGFKRLSLGAKVRLRYAYIIRCDEVVKDTQGNVTELRCTYEPDTSGDPRNRTKGVIHWLSAEHAPKAEFRLYDRLFSIPDPDEAEGHFTSYLNPHSLETKRGFVEPSVAEDSAAKDPERTRYQFERQGYFVRDPDSRQDALVFNRTVTLRDTWAKTHEAEVRPSAQTRTTSRVKARPIPEAKRNEVHDPVADLSPEASMRYESYTKLELSREEAAVLAKDEALGAYFRRTYALHPSPQLASWVVGEVGRERKDERAFTVPPEALGELVRLIDGGTLSTRLAKEVFAEMVQTGKAAGQIVEHRGLEQLSDTSTLEPIVAALVAQHPDKAQAYRSGKTGLLGFFVGQVMRETQGKANPQQVQGLVKEALVSQ